MATVVQMQSPLDRSSSSFDPPRSRSTPPFSHHPSSSSSRSSYDLTRSPSPNVVRPPLHHRSSSNASASSSPYNQPFSGPSYFPQANPMISQQQQQQQQPQQHHHQQAQFHHGQNAWTTSAIPANAFYPSPMQLHPGQSFQQGFQQSQADFAAWATAYHQMVAASMANGHGQGHGQGGGFDQGMMPPQPEYLSERRRTNSGPTSSSTSNFGNMESGNHHFSTQKYPSSSAQPSSQPYHPYKRGPSQPSSTEYATSNGLPRSTSHPALPSPESMHSPSSSVSTTRQETHRRTASMESSASKPSVIPPRVASRQESYQSEKDRAIRSPPTITAVPRSSSPAPSGKSAQTSGRTTPVATPVQERPKTPLPLHSGPIANATNTPHPASAARPSPLSQATSAEPEKAKSGGLRSRLKKALDKDASTPKKSSSMSTSVNNRTANKPTFPSPSETSTRSATPPITPPQSSDFPPPSAPFAVSHPVAMGSEISLAETDRTATAPSEMGGNGKQKKSLFRMKNMSTDNISLSSTVSSASMMIRKMGSIGKLARRNSLMGISKIFKDKPKDEDAALPEKDAKKKKKSKKDKGKAQAAPAAVTHATAETDRVSEEEDRALAGLSPAAKLARQHTLKSKAEQAKRDSLVAAKTGEPAWDNNTATRTNSGNLPSISSVTGPPEVLHVTPGRTSTVVHAVQVSEQEYDSEDDSSDGETVEDATIQMAKSRLSDSSFADREFRQLWGNAWIDRNAIPKRGILKVTKSNENLELTASRQRSNSSAQVPHQAHPHPHHGGPLDSPQADVDQVDGLTHPTPHPHQSEEKYDPFSVSFDPFTSGSSGDYPTTHPYVNPGHNTSAPTLSLVAPGKPVAARSMTAPMRKTLEWAPECAVYSTYDAMTYDRRSEPATCNRLTPELAQMIKQELNAFKLEMPVHPNSRSHTHFFS